MAGRHDWNDWDSYQTIHKDNVHSQAGSALKHHRHRYDRAGNEMLPAKYFGASEWPTLSEVIREAWVWWQENL